MPSKCSTSTSVTAPKPTHFADLNARQRARQLLDEGTFHELLGPFDRVMSPWLTQQDIVPQSDDGVVIAQGRINGQPTVIAAIEGGFQGGSLGEVAGAKIAGALELALEDNLAGIPTAAVLVLETGGVRLQEANLGLAAIAEIQSAIVALRDYQPVIGIITGPVGCFGGMSIAAGLCSYLLMTREGRLGLNGPQVIEQEAGIEEYNAQDRPFIWGISGGIQRHQTGLVDACTGEDVASVREAVITALQQGIPRHYRSDDWEHFLTLLQTLDPVEHLDAAIAKSILTQPRRSSQATSAPNITAEKAAATGAQS